MEWTETSDINYFLSRPDIIHLFIQYNSQFLSTTYSEHSGTKSLVEAIPYTLFEKNPPSFTCISLSVSYPVTSAVAPCSQSTSPSYTISGTFLIFINVSYYIKTVTFVNTMGVFAGSTGI